MTSRKKRAPAIFEPAQPIRCHFCSAAQDEIREWLHDSLVATYDAGKPRWPVKSFRRAAEKEFGRQISDTTLARHLKEHEPAWRLWDGQEGQASARRIRAAG